MKCSSSAGFEQAYNAQVAGDVVAHAKEDGEHIFLGPGCLRGVRETEVSAGWSARSSSTIQHTYAQISVGGAAVGRENSQNCCA